MKVILFLLTIIILPEAGAKTLIVGDSVFALSGEIRRELQKLAGESIESRAQSGAKMLSRSGVLSPIPTQYQRVQGRGYDTVIMNGGGNDVLIDNRRRCRAPLSDYCRNLLGEINQRAQDLMRDMVTNGVKNIIFLGYYHLPGSLSSLDESTNYGSELMLPVCEQNFPEVNCAAVDSRKIFKDQAGVIGLDGIHPSTKGARLLAKGIWQKWESFKEQGKREIATSCTENECGYVPGPDGQWRFCGQCSEFSKPTYEELNCDKTKRPLLLVHGTAGTSDNWSGLTSLLIANGYCRDWIKPIIWDGISLLGSAQSKMSQGVAELLRMPEVREAGHLKIDVAGHSRGGGEVKKWVKRNSFRVNSAVVIGSTGGSLTQVPCLNLVGGDDDIVSAGAINGCSTVIMPDLGHLSVQSSTQSAVEVYRFQSLLRTIFVLILSM